MNQNIENIFENNWNEIKDGVRNLWDKLTKEDIKQIDGSLDIMTGKLKKYYGFKKEEIENELLDLLDNLGIDIVEKGESPIKVGQRSIERYEKVLSRFFRECLNTVKSKSITLEEECVEYVKENPIKVFAIATIVGVAVSTVFVKRS